MVEPVAHGGEGRASEAAAFRSVQTTNPRRKSFPAREPPLASPLMSLLARLDSDIKDAMRARAAERLGVLRMLKSSLKAHAIDKGLADDAIDETTALSIVRKELKKRQDSVEAFEKGGRMDLANKEKSEAEILAVYLPQPLSLEEVEDLVKNVIAELGATSKAQMGVVMKAATERAGGRADGRALSSAVGKLLAP
jgi:uncharacterized protein